MEEGIHLTELEVGVGVRGELSISKRQNQTKQLQSWCYCYCCECLFVLSLQEDPFGAYGCSLFLEFNHCSNGLFHSPPSLSSFPLFDLSLCNRWVLCAVLGSGVVWFRVDSDGSVLFSLILFFLRCFTFWGCVFSFWSLWGSCGCLLWRWFRLEFSVGGIKDYFLFVFFQFGLSGVHVRFRITDFCCEFWSWEGLVFKFLWLVIWVVWLVLMRIYFSYEYV